MTARVRYALTFAAIVAGVALGTRMSTLTAGDKKEAEPLVYELRTYTTAEGRLPALHKRFKDHTLKIFEKHGMKNIIYWVPEDKENTLVYVIAHKSRKAADASWDAFRNDPDWKKAFADSRKDGKIVTKVERQFLKATDYSPMK